MSRACRRSRIMSAAIAVGSRLPAFHTSSAACSSAFSTKPRSGGGSSRVRIEPYTPSTITDLQALFDRIRDDHEQGFSIVDEELERGLRSIAVPVVDRRGEVGRPRSTLAPTATRTTRNEMRDRFLPGLRAVAAQIARSSLDARAIAVDRRHRVKRGECGSTGVPRRSTFRTRDPPEPLAHRCRCPYRLEFAISHIRSIIEQNLERSMAAARGRWTRADAAKPQDAADSGRGRREAFAASLRPPARSRSPRRRPAPSISPRSADGREVYIYGERVKDVTKHRPSATPRAWWRGSTTRCTTPSARTRSCCRPTPATAA